MKKEIAYTYLIIFLILCLEIFTLIKIYYPKGFLSSFGGNGNDMFFIIIVFTSLLIYYLIIYLIIYLTAIKNTSKIFFITLCILPNSILFLCLIGFGGITGESIKRVEIITMLLFFILPPILVIFYFLRYRRIFRQNTNE